MKLAGPDSWSLAVKFPLTLTAVVAGVGFTIGAVIVHQDAGRFRASLDEKALLLARTVAASTPESALRNDTWSLYKSLRSTRSLDFGEGHDTHILTAMILDPEGRVLAHLDPARHPVGLPLTSADTLEQGLLDGAMRARAPRVLAGPSGRTGFVEAVFPIYADDKRVGVVRLRLSTADLHARTWTAALTVLGLTLILVVLGSALGAIISMRMIRPLRLLSRGMETIGRSDLSEVAPLPVEGGDELGRLTQSFNRMAAELAEKRRLEDELAVNEKLVALGRVAAGVAHEVNNPLAGMLNCFDTLKKHPEEPELLGRYLPLLETGLNRIHQIVRGLLVEIRTEGAHEPCGPECMEELKELIEAEVGERDVTLLWENRLPADVRVNRPPVQQIVFNLLKNALQAVPDGGTIAFRAYRNGEGLLLEVSDDGPGIAEADRDRLFDPFFTTKTSGTGLGLWIVYRLVESLHGVIRIESEPGSGTWFQVHVPVAEEEQARWAN